MKHMKHGSLFSGIGGFDLAAQWCGWTNVFQCENDTFCQRVLKYHFPDTELYEDIKTTDFTKYRGAIDIISGGFPCQPFSEAGKGKGTDDNRYLWPEMFRVIREVQPAWVVAENVRGLLARKHVMVFECVCTDLESQGYEVQSFIIPACAVGAPHRRDRIWIIAHRADAGTEGMQQEGENGVYEPPTVTHPNGRVQNDEGKPPGQLEQNIPDWRNFPTQSPVCRRDDGLSGGLDGITFSAWRRGAIKALGNAIVSQIAYEYFKIIDSYD